MALDAQQPPVLPTQTSSSRSPFAGHIKEAGWREGTTEFRNRGSFVQEKKIKAD
jgi:hypothetical protein